MTIHFVTCILKLLVWFVSIGVIRLKREFLANQRISRNLTQEQVAGDLGISTIYLRKLEGGHSKPGRETMLKLERYYNTSMKELFPDLFDEKVYPTKDKN